MNSDQDEKRWRVNSVSKALQILECFDLRNSELSLTQISERVHAPKSTISNLIKTLMSEGYLRKSSTSQNYLLGLKLFEQGSYVRNSLPIISYAIPIMEDITRETGEITYLSTMVRDKLLVMEGIYPNRRFNAYSTAGKCLPLHCCSAGKMILSTLPDKLVLQITDNGMYQSTPNTIVEQQELLDELNKIRKAGFSIDHEEETLGVCCASVAIYGSDSRAVGAISLSGSCRTVTDEKINESLPVLEKAAQFLSRYASSFPVEYYDDKRI